ncbi:hypothetical protein V5R04_12740 [Jonesiaceae bacterium BS-20]|uniref:Uncharacterized protein n=1 Tax=Jonesiaceae bacterium BS-20 TaxID=3120821 RepID=A0AAU7DUE7_9MICO
MSRWIVRGVFAVFVVVSAFWFVNRAFVTGPPVLGNTIVLTPPDVPYNDNGNDHNDDIN